MRTSTIDRRQALRYGLTAATALAVGPGLLAACSDDARSSAAGPTSPPILEGSGRGTAVGIVGGGPAGVASALELARAGYDVTLLEARDRFGGRVWTAKRGDRTDPVSGPVQTCEFEPGQYADMGAMRIHTSMQATLHYCRTLSIPLQTWINWNANAFLYMTSASAGELAGTPLRIGRVVQDLAGYLSQYALESEAAEGLATAAQTFGKLQSDGSYQGSTSAGYAELPSMESQGVALDPLQQSALASYGTATASAPFAPLGPFPSFDEQPTMLHPVEGMQAIPNAIAAAARLAGALMILEAEVTGLDQDDTGVDITYVRRGETASRRFDYVILAIQPALIDQVATNLSTAALDALSQVTQATAGKVGLQAFRRFWEVDDEVYGGISYTDTDPGLLVYPPFGYMSGSGVLETYNTDASALGNLDLAGQRAAVLDAIRGMHPGVRDRDFGPSFSVMWENERYSRASWEFFGDEFPGSNTPSRQLLLEPDGRTYFAGDWMSFQPGWCQGAF